MELKHFLTWAALVLSFVLCSLIRSSTAKPATYSSGEDYYVPVEASDRIDDDYYVSAPLTNYHLNQLRRGYYFVDDGYITAVSNSPFAPSASAGTSHRRTSGVRYKPLVNIRQTRTKRKKLFVPNLFG